MILKNLFVIMVIFIHQINCKLFSNQNGDSSLQFKKCLVYGNCQGEFVSHFLKREFGNELDCDYICNHQLIFTNSPLPKKKFEDIDLFIYQPIFGHGNYDTDYIITNLLNEGCLSVGFPYLCFYGYFPDYFHDPMNNKFVSDRHPHGIFPYGHKSIVNLIESGKYTIEEIIEESKSDSFITLEIITKQVKYTLDYLKKYEESTDVKISWFIEQNYMNYRLFHTANHPTNILLKVMIKLILNHINLDNNSINRNAIFNNEYFGHYIVPIYPCIEKHLNLKFSEKNTLLIYGNKYSTYDEYFTDYIKLLYPGSIFEQEQCEK